MAIVHDACGEILAFEDLSGLALVAGAENLPRAPVDMERDAFFVEQYDSLVDRFEQIPRRRDRGTRASREYAYLFHDKVEIGVPQRLPENFIGAVRDGGGEILALAGRGHENDRPPESARARPRDELRAAHERHIEIGKQKRRFRRGKRVEQASRILETDQPRCRAGRGAVREEPP